MLWSWRDQEQSWKPSAQHCSRLLKSWRCPSSCCHNNFRQLSSRMSLKKSKNSTRRCKPNNGEHVCEATPSSVGPGQELSGAFWVSRLLQHLFILRKTPLQHCNGSYFQATVCLSHPILWGNEHCCLNAKTWDLISPAAQIQISQIQCYVWGWGVREKLEPEIVGEVMVGRSKL